MPTAKEVLKRQWEKWLKDWLESGKSQAAWCRDHSICIHVFYYWRKKLLSSPTPAESHDKFVELVDTPTSTSSGITIEYSDFTLTLSKDFHPETLTNCLQALKRIKC